MEILTYSFVLIIVFYLFLRIDMMEKRVKQMHNLLERMEEAADLPEDPLHDELRRMIKQGEEIKAIKLARNKLGLSLIEGKHYIDKLK